MMPVSGLDPFRAAATACSVACHLSAIVIAVTGS
jgi:hypothetical protein